VVWKLRGRYGEREELDRLLETVRSGRSGALVVRGEPGMGKTALLDHLVEQASGFRVVRTAGVQSEMELAFAGLHQLCGPMLDRADRLPEPQRDALHRAFGLVRGPAPDRFLVGLAALGLLAEVAREQPLLCVVDDTRWLGAASAQVLAFVARRLVAESVAIVFANRSVHRALAEVTDPETEPDRRAWHPAQAAAGPDEEVAADLERSAGRAQARGGMAAAAAFLERAARLTPEPCQRAQRLLAAAHALHQSGAPGAALRLLPLAEAGPLDKLQRARVDLLRARIALTVNRGREAPPLLLKAARQLEPLDARLARDTYLDAFLAAMFAGSFAIGGGVREVAEAALAAPPAPRPAGPGDQLLDGLAVRFTAGYAAGLPPLRRALAAFRNPHLSTDELGWLWLARITAGNMWDEAIERLGRTQVRGEHARAHLLYGEWLRRRRRRFDAREQLRTAHEMFTGMGNARLGEARRRRAGGHGRVRPQAQRRDRHRADPKEAQIVHLIRQGLSNPEIAQRLFLSRRTVEWHIGRIFGKLGVTSRRQLRH